MKITFKRIIAFFKRQLRKVKFLWLKIKRKIAPKTLTEKEESYLESMEVFKKEAIILISADLDYLLA